MQKIIFIFGGIILVIAYPFFAIRYFEMMPPLLMIWHYWLIPIAILIILFFPKIYYRKLRNNKSEKSKIKRVMQDITTMLLGSLCSIALLNAIILSLIITTNTWVITPKAEKIKTPVIEYTKGITSKGRTTHDIKLIHQNDTISLGVRREYKIGEYFVKTMYRGRWGFLYSKD